MNEYSEPGSSLSPTQALQRFSEFQDSVITAARTETLRLRYGFRIGGIGLLIDQDTTSEVIDKPSVYPLPNTPRWLAGLINLRGNLAPLFDLRELLALHGELHSERRILVLDEGEYAAGFYTDGLPEQPDLSRQLQRLPPLATSLRDHVSTAYVKDGFVWMEFDHRGFLQSLTARIAA